MSRTRTLRDVQDTVISGVSSSFSPLTAPLRMRRLQIALIVFAILNLAVVVWDAVTGGFRATVFGVVISSREIRKPFLYAVVSALAAIWIRDQTATRTSWDLMFRHGRGTAAVIALTSIATAIHFGIFAAGGSDAWGYVSQANLWATGKLFLPNWLPDVTKALGRAVAPLGYTMSPSSDAIVPVYSPGLPLMMALAQTLGGAQAVYLVVPLLGGLTIWLTYMLADRLEGSHTALIASFVVALSPLFVFQTLQPMSDVPVAALWLAAFLLALRPGGWTALGAGLATGLAVLTRSNLVPLAVVIAAIVVQRRPRSVRLLLFMAPVGVAALLIAFLNRTFHGSPLRSGYGPLDYLYASNRIVPNLGRYFMWLVESYSPLILIAFAAPLIRRNRTVAWMFVFFFALLACYLPYFTFDHWTFLRFLLPAIPLLVILATLVIMRGVERIPVRWRGVTMIVLCGAAALYFGVRNAELQVLAIYDAEHRYQSIGTFIGHELPPNAVVLTQIQSGSVRMYGDRPTVRWDWLPGDRLDDAISVLSAHGYEPYILVEDWEEPRFNELFAKSNIFGRIDWRPAIEYCCASRVRIYAVADRAKYLAGELAPPPRVIPAP